MKNRELISILQQEDLDIEVLIGYEEYYRLSEVSDGTESVTESIVGIFKDNSGKIILSQDSYFYGDRLYPKKDN